MADHTQLVATRDDEYEIIGRIRQQRDQSFIVPAEWSVRSGMDTSLRSSDRR
jgi:hypothetical protein